MVCAVPPAAIASKAGWLIAAVVLAAARLARAHEERRRFQPNEVIFSAPAARPPSRKEPAMQ